MTAIPPIAVDVTVIGHFARDKLVFRGQESISSGGSVYYGAIALRRIELSVVVITRLRAEDFPYLDELKQEGIAVLAQPADQTSGIENVYTAEYMDRRICKPLGFAGRFRLEDIPDITAKAFLVGPIIAGEVDLALVRALAERRPVALDVQGFVCVREGDDLVFRDWPQKAEGLAYVHTLKVDSAEVLTGQTDPAVAIRELATYGPREIVLTQTSGVLVYADGREYRAPFTPRELKGRTGWGDTCFACYVGKRLSASPEEARRFAVAVTTLNLEKPGPFRSTLEDVERYLAE